MIIHAAPTQPTWVDDGTQIIYADTVFIELRDDTVWTHCLVAHIINGQIELHRTAVVVFTLRGFTNALQSANKVWGMGQAATH